MKTTTQRKSRVSFAAVMNSGEVAKIHHVTRHPWPLSTVEPAVRHRRRPHAGYLSTCQEEAEASGSPRC